MGDEKVRAVGLHEINAEEEDIGCQQIEITCLDNPGEGTSS